MIEVIETGLMELIDVKFEKMVTVEMRVVSDRSFQTEMRLIAPIAEVVLAV